MDYGLFGGHEQCPEFIPNCPQPLCISSSHHWPFQALTWFMDTIRIVLALHTEFLKKGPNRRCYSFFIYHAAFGFPPPIYHQQSQHEEIIMAIGHYIDCQRTLLRLWWIVPVAGQVIRYVQHHLKDPFQSIDYRRIKLPPPPLEIAGVFLIICWISLLADLQHLTTAETAATFLHHVTHALVTGTAIHWISLHRPQQNK